LHNEKLKRFKQFINTTLLIVNVLCVFLQTLINTDSLDCEAIYFRARCNFFLENYDQTIVDLIKVANAGYREFDSYYNIGNIYWILAQYSNSVKYFKIALEYDPSNQEVIEIIEVLEEAVEIFENSKIVY
ncbi:MAG: hypothetical protein CVT92_16685, partial [Bacteroidetes bacterium HGW-Bacteroidetes-1]